MQGSERKTYVFLIVCFPCRVYFPTSLCGVLVLSSASSVVSSVTPPSLLTHSLTSHLSHSHASTGSPWADGVRARAGRRCFAGVLPLRFAITVRCWCELGTALLLRLAMKARCWCELGTVLLLFVAKAARVR